MEYQNYREATFKKTMRLTLIYTVMQYSKTIPQC